MYTMNSVAANTWLRGEPLLDSCAAGSEAAAEKHMCAMKKAALAKPCYASQHLTPEEWGILEVCLRLTYGGKNRFFLDGRSLANRFDQTGKNTVYRIVKRLERKGWLVRVDGGMRNQQTGMYDSTKYRVLSHQEWTKLDGNTCREYCWTFPG
jgi:hypothetical protein